MDSVKFTKQPDGTFIQSGELPKGTRTVKLYMDGQPDPMGATNNAKDMLAILVDLTTTRPAKCPKSVYELRPVVVDSPEVIAVRTVNLAKARAARKAKKDA